MSIVTFVNRKGNEIIAQSGKPENLIFKEA